LTFGEKDTIINAENKPQREIVRHKKRSIKHFLHDIPNLSSAGAALPIQPLNKALKLADKDSFTMDSA